MNRYKPEQAIVLWLEAQYVKYKYKYKYKYEYKYEYKYKYKYTVNFLPLQDSPP